ncbi:uncharacterized protein ACNS7B_018788 isoform 1-T5 [Menidia menidia]
MDSQLASVLTSGSQEVQNGSRCGEGSEPVAEVFLDPKDNISCSPKPGSLKPCPARAAEAVRQDAQSINGKKPEEGGTSKPASQGTTRIGGFRQPITVKTGVPVLRRQPIRIKIVVPPRCKRPITNSAISLTKDCVRSRFKGPVLVSAGAVITERSRSQIHISALKNEGDILVTCQKTEEEAEVESSRETESKKGDRISNDGGVLNVKILRVNGSEAAFIPSTHSVKVLSRQGLTKESTEREMEQNIPFILEEINLKSFKTFTETEMDEQTEPLDLSLPKRREGRDRKCGRLLDDSGCEGPLIMEVDEYEGDGDRDTVEEDDGDPGLLLDRPLLSPSLLSTSGPASPSPDTENLLLIDDQGIPYTLSPDGFKVPQVSASTAEGRPEQAGETGPPLADRGLGQSLDDALTAPSDSFDPSASPASEASAGGAEETDAPEGLINDSDAAGAAEPDGQAADGAGPVVSPFPGIPLPSQPIQILPSPAAHPPLLLLSPPPSAQLASAPVSLSLPLPVPHSSAGASAPMFLLLSSAPPSPGEHASTSAQIAVLDPSTGQLSHITAAPAPVSLPLSSGPVGSLGSPLPLLSHPVIRLSPNNPPLILTGVNNLTSGPVLASLTVPSSALAPQDEHQVAAPLVQTQISYSESNPGSEAISAEEASSEDSKPLAFAAPSPRPQPAACDPPAQPAAEAEAPSPASEPKFDSSVLHSEHLPLDDHLYFSNMAAPPSPPLGPMLPSGKLDSLDALDPLSPAESPSTLGSRRVLCCQLCPRIFFYLSDLERHAITHSQKKPHVCQQCGKAFKRSSHLQRHKHIHTGQRNFVCPICAKRFREAGELQRHQRVHTGEKPYQCQLCHTRFAERNTLRRHTKRKHPYHQVAMEMLNERKDRGGPARGDGPGSGGAGVQEEEESAEWYSSTVSTLDNSESEMEA